ncbi:MAG: ABC transporter ATP-binding protein [Bacteroidales bacterium]|nr:ABC transporter ATP-binding protein [Bacteroidales bacterium]MBN2821157.1 ABC transporter ATP-binding protein [Bacteroidales bacterium]
MELAEGNKTLLETKNLQVGYRLHKGRKHVLLDALNLTISSGELITFIGPNGSGKSTLIKTLVDLIPLLKGKIYLSGKNYREISSAEKASLMGVVLTDPVYERNMTVFDVVSLGRYQHTNWLGAMTDSDRKSVLTSIEHVGLTDKITSRLNELSDGERQRALIAKVLAQDVDLIILDEPTAHLDLPNRMETLLLLHQISHQSGKGILLSTHELGLAMQISDKVWLINHEHQLIQSLPEDLMLNGYLDSTFGNDHIGFHPFSASFELVPDKKIKANISGDGLVTACVIRLLRRLRMEIIQNPGKNDVLIAVNEQLKEINVVYRGKNTFNSIADLQNYLIQLLND